MLKLIINTFTTYNIKSEPEVPKTPQARDMLHGFAKQIYRRHTGNSRDTLNGGGKSNTYGTILATAGQHTRITCSEKAGGHWQYSSGMFRTVYDYIQRHCRWYIYTSMC